MVPRRISLSLCPHARWRLRAVGNHALTNIWEGILHLEIHGLLDEMKTPVILWIGVKPASLDGGNGAVIALKCRQILIKFDIIDVNVEIRESIVTRLIGLKLLKPIYSTNPTVDFRERLTSTLGLPICARSTPWVEGTGGFFITEGGNTNRLLLITARHVVLVPNKHENKHFEREHTSQRRHNITLFGDTSKGFEKYLESIKHEIQAKTYAIQHQEKRIRTIGGEDSPEANTERQDIQIEIHKAKRAIEALNTFYQDVSTRWATRESRILGHVILSPPINVGVGNSSEGYTEDWAAIEIDASKIDASNFDGNTIDLGTHISPYDFTCMMYPNPRNSHCFEYPDNRLLRLRGAIPDEEMRCPTSFDQHNEPCLMVIKRGSTKLPEGEISKEWAILPRRLGFCYYRRIGGLLTGGTGVTDSTDIN
ncbi:hypothetical protein V8E54_014359 [Elaphomyces granulatus]